MARAPRKAKGRLARWLANAMPTREQLAQSRWIKPFGTRILQSEYWRFTRRSVPRGVAVGLFVGVFFLIPGVQFVAATLSAILVRGNIPVAAGMTFLTNPFTTPFLIIASIPVGNLLGFHADKSAVIEMYSRSAPIREWVAWLASDAAPALISGLFIVAVASGAIGYVLSILVWRWWTARKWRQRALETAAPD